jgi:hypothetical protein
MKIIVNGSEIEVKPVYATSRNCNQPGYANITIKMTTSKFLGGYEREKLEEHICKILREE